MPLDSNYTPLSPQSFLRRNARVYPNKPAVVYGDSVTTYAEFFQRACRLANALDGLGVSREEKVAALLPNTPAHLDCAFGVHMAGAVLVAINYRLNPREIAFILNHSDARVLIVDWEFLPLIQPVMNELGDIRQIIVVHEDAGPQSWEPHGALDYDALVGGADDTYPNRFPADENDAISINYTSGTTGNPKGVLYTHRSTYMNAVCGVLQSTLLPDSVYLWTLPMFHCNGWCYTWGVTAMGATHVCLRKVEPTAVVQTILDQQVTHFNGAPIVLRMVADGAKELKLQRFPKPVKVTTAAAPPSPAVIRSMIELNVSVVHVYGLTETYGPMTVCEIQPDWKDLPVEQMASLMARQGVPFVLAEDLQILDEMGHPVPADGMTLGEVCMKGNIVAAGYYKNDKATAEAMRDGWFHSGDLGVMHPDGYIELRDRAKDIIISGGENISTIEVENTLYSHPAVLDCAVVSRPDEKWGEVPVAFVTLRDGTTATADQLIGHCRDQLAGYKVPKTVYFEALPRTSTGKVQKFVLRDRMWAGQETRIQG